MKLDEKDVSMMCEMYRNGQTIMELAVRFGISMPSVAKILKKNGVEIRGRGVRRDIRKEDILNYLSSNVGYVRKAAMYFGVSDLTMRKYIRKYGLSDLFKRMRKR